MKKKFVFLAILMLLPITVLAEEKVVISCDKTTIKNNEEMNCKIEVSGLDYTVTSISGKVKVKENLKIVDSSYDSNTWKIFDEFFDIKNINLVSESKDKKETLTIATFKVKAVNSEKVTSAISFNDVILGDEDYNDHEIKVDPVNVELEYEEVDVDNPDTGDYELIIFAISVIVFSSLILVSMKKVKGELTNE